MFIAVNLSMTDVICQESQLKPSKTAALDAWGRGSYEVAYENFNGLLLLYPRDPLYKYYTGACLVSLQRDIPRAVSLLGSAISSSINIRSVPGDVWFYYGRALHLNGIYDQATEAYNRFIRVAGKKVSSGYEVQAFLDQCTKRQGALSGEPERPAYAEDAAGNAVTEAIINVDTVSFRDGQKQVVTELAARVTDSTVPEEFNDKLREAVKLQHSADSTARILKWVQKEADAAPPGKKAEMLQKTEFYSKEAAKKQAEADSAFLLVEQNAMPSPAVTETTGEPAASHLLSQFEVRTESDYGSRKPVTSDTGAPAGLVYRIQIAAFRNPIQPSLFKGLYPLYWKKKVDTGIIYYYAGLFRTFEDARQALPQVRAAGFSDAFIVAMMDDSQVSLEKAALFEKDWASKPLFTGVPEAREKNTVSEPDTLPVGTLMFRAEVMRSKKPVRPEVTEKIQLLAGSKGFDMIKNNDGETVFLIGNFITFESADEYVSLLIRNGYSTAKVVAYVGAYEIPVEEARELINRL